MVLVPSDETIKFSGAAVPRTLILDLRYLEKRFEVFKAIGLPKAPCCSQSNEQEGTRLVVGRTLVVSAQHHTRDERRRTQLSWMKRCNGPIKCREVERYTKYDCTTRQLFQTLQNNGFFLSGSGTLIARR